MSSVGIDHFTNRSWRRILAWIIVGNSEPICAADVFEAVIFEAFLIYECTRKEKIIEVRSFYLDVNTNRPYLIRHGSFFDFWNNLLLF